MVPRKKSAKKWSLKIKIMPFKFGSYSAGYLTKKKTVKREKKGPFYHSTVDFGHWLGDTFFCPIRTIF